MCGVRKGSHASSGTRRRLLPGRSFSCKCLGIRVEIGSVCGSSSRLRRPACPSPPGPHPLGHHSLVGSSEVGKWESSRFVPLFQHIPAALGPGRPCECRFLLHSRCQPGSPRARREHSGAWRVSPRRTRPLRPGVASLPPQSGLLTASTSSSFQSVNMHLFRYSFLSTLSPSSSRERNCFPGFLGRWLVSGLGKHLTSCSPFPSALSRLPPRA